MHNRHSTPRCLYPKSSGPAPSEQELSEDTRSAEHCAFSSLPLLAGRAAIVGMVCVAENSLRLSAGRTPVLVERDIYRGTKHPKDAELAGLSFTSSPLQRQLPTELATFRRNYEAS